MDKTKVLIGVAEIAITLGGFSGVLMMFRRSADPWLPEDRMRLVLLLFSSFATAAAAFLPLVLWEIAGAEHRVWRVSCAAWPVLAIWYIRWARSLYAHFRADDPAMRQRYSPVLFNVMIYGVTPVLVALSLANAAFWGAFTPYLVILVWGLVAAGIEFLRLLQSAMR